ncbi:hypothetical protein BCV71DRAFT_283522, partial [Rhizopus microsporus]
WLHPQSSFSNFINLLLDWSKFVFVNHPNSLWHHPKFAYFIGHGLGLGLVKAMVSVLVTMSESSSLVIKVFQSPKFIQLLAESIIKKDCPSFSFVQVELLGNGSYFALYMAQSCAILLEIQSNITKISMKQSVKKCLEVFYRFDIQPLLVILCVDKISSSCIIILKDAIDSIEDEPNKLDPLVVFAIYFSNDEIQKQKLRDIGNPYTRDINDC